MSSNARLDKMSQMLHLGTYTRHILLCTGGKCAESEEQQQAWQLPKKRLNALGQVVVKPPVFRPNVAGPRVCGAEPD